MKWIIKISSKAENYFEKLNKELQNRLKEKIIDLSNYDNPILHKDVKSLTGQLKGFYRLRIGGYRVVFSLLSNEKIIAIVNIAPRGDVYKK
ncbi:MAG: type II toxin-antitoxin system RelE/ParE family toxin [Candidatus Desantisbacteria bacterium]